MKTVIFIRTTSIYNDSRAMKEIMTFSRHGYNVIALGWDRDGKALSKCQEIFGGNVKFYFYMAKLNNIGFRHIDKLIEWFLWVFSHLKTVTQQKGTFIIHACNLDTGIPSLLFYKKYKSDSLKFVYDIYDYYVDSHHIPSILQKHIDNLEITAINSADLTIICNEERKRQITKAIPKKLLVIHNAPDLRDVNLSITGNLYDYAYCGSLAPARLIKEILDSYNKNQDIRMVIAGYGMYDTLAKATSLKYTNFHYKGTLSYPEVLKMEASAKILSAIYDPSIANHKFAAPNKFYEAMALGKPIIVCEGTGIDLVVKKYELGIVIPYEAKSFYEAMRKLLENPNLCNQMGSRAKGLFLNKYNWSKMEDFLLEAYESL